MNYTLSTTFEQRRQKRNIKIIHTNKPEIKTSNESVNVKDKIVMASSKPNPQLESLPDQTKKAYNIGVN